MNQTVLGIDREKIKQLGDDWSDGGLWNDVLWLAARFWESTSNERLIAWHHLVMAVGNFKRQPNRRLQPASISPNSPVAVTSCLSFQVPGTTSTICCEIADTWVFPFSGAGSAPTATALLSALWPGRHLILDWRVLAAAIALTLDDGVLNFGVEATSTESVVLDLHDHYPAVRELLLKESQDSGVPLITIERGLYRLTQMVNGKGRKWGTYRRSLLEAAATPAVELGSANRAPTDGPADDEQDSGPEAP